MVTELTGNRLHHPGAKSLYVGEGSSMAVTTMKQLGFFSSVSVVQMHHFEQRNVLYKDNSFDFLFSKDLGEVSVPTLLGIFIGFDNLDGVICIIREASSNSVATTGLRNGNEKSGLSSKFYDYYDFARLFSIILMMMVGHLAFSIGTSYWMNVILLGLYMKFSIECERTGVPISMELFHGIGEFFTYAILSAGMICLEWWSFELLTLLFGLLLNPELETSVLSICGENGGGLEVVSLACGLVGGDTLMSYTPLSVTLLSSQAQDNEAAYQSLKNGMEKSQ
ncbi:hypothetical protein JHK85_001718 [Glycine max]|nr:hypothetical protein JHK85_001718 [Glycine max]KAG5089066.1 hypothetical protein JHK86_001678 [Glycine max]